MVNTTDFIERLEHLLHYYGLTASSFADKVGVQRSSISHLLSERNKPSLEFVLKVVKTFPEVNLYWLLNGKGSFPTDGEKVSPPPEVSSATKHPTVAEDERIVTTEPEPGNLKKPAIDRIVIFYADGSFENYHSK